MLVFRLTLCAFSVCHILHKRYCAGLVLRKTDTDLLVVPLTDSILDKCKIGALRMLIRRIVPKIERYAFAGLMNIILHRK